MSAPRIYIWIVSHLSAKNYQNWCKFDEVLTKTNLLSFFGTRCICRSTHPIERVQYHPGLDGAKSCVDDRENDAMRHKDDGLP